MNGLESAIAAGLLLTNSIQAPWTPAYLQWHRATNQQLVATISTDTSPRFKRGQSIGGHPWVSVVDRYLAEVTSNLVATIVWNGTKHTVVLESKPVTNWVYETPAQAAETKLLYAVP